MRPWQRWMYQVRYFIVGFSMTPFPSPHMNKSKLSFDLEFSSKVSMIFFVRLVAAAMTLNFFVKTFHFKV